MTQITVYCVQPFWRAGPTKLARGDLKQFQDEGKARRAGENAARRLGGAIVYSVVGNPDYEHWEPPRLVLQLGDVPEVQF